MGLAAGSSSADDGGAEYFSGGSITVTSSNGANAVGGPVVGTSTLSGYVRPKRSGLP